MMPLWQSREQAEDIAEKLRKFGQPLRLMILSLLLEGEKSAQGLFDLQRASTLKFRAVWNAGRQPTKIG